MVNSAKPNHLSYVVFDLINEIQAKNAGECSVNQVARILATKYSISLYTARDIVRGFLDNLNEVISEQRKPILIAPEPPPLTITENVARWAAMMAAMKPPHR